MTKALGAAKTRSKQVFIRGVGRKKTACLGCGWGHEGRRQVFFLMSHEVHLDMQSFRKTLSIDE